jgi:hypothetical protein
VVFSFWCSYLTSLRSLRLGTPRFTLITISLLTPSFAPIIPLTTPFSVRYTRSPRGGRLRCERVKVMKYIPSFCGIFLLVLILNFFAESPPRDSALYSHYYFFTHSFLCPNYSVNYSFLGSLYAESPRRETPLRKESFFNI